MKAVLQPEQFVDNYLTPIWNWFTDMFLDFQNIFTVNRISQYIFYMIWLEAIILPFSFWLVMTFILSYRNKRITFFGVSYFRNLKTVNSSGLNVRFNGSIKNAGLHNRFIGSLNGSIHSKVTGTFLTPRVSGSPLNTKFSSSKYKLSLMPYQNYSAKFVRYSGLHLYEPNWKNIYTLRNAFSDVGRAEDKR